MNGLATLPSVAAVLRGAASPLAQEVAALPHAVAAISDLAFAELWTIPRACEANLPALLPRLAARYESSRAQAPAQPRAPTIGGGVRASSPPLSPPLDRKNDDGDFDRSDPFFHALECRQGLVWAVAHDNLEMAEWLHAHCPRVLPYAAMVKAAARGNLRLLRWLRERHPRAVWVPAVLNAAAAGGHVEVLQWLRSGQPMNQFGCTSKALKGAALNGHLEALKLLQPMVRSDSRSLATIKFEVLRNGHVDVFKHLYRDVTMSPELVSAVKSAAEGGKAEMVLWALHHMFGSMRRAGGTDDYYSIKLDFTMLLSTAVEGAAKGGQRGVLDGLQSSHFSQYVSTLGKMKFAACGGHFNLMKQIYAQNGCERSMNTVGQSPAEKYVLDRARAECTSALRASLAGAVAGGHLEIAKWLLERLPDKWLTQFSLDQAARDGHLDMLKWLHATTRGKVAADAINEAAANGHLEVVKWLAERDTKGNLVLTTRAFDRAVENGHLKVAKWMHARGVVGIPMFNLDRVAALGRLEVIKWLDAVGLAGGISDYGHCALTTAAQLGYLDVAMYLFPRFGTRGLLANAFGNSKLWIEHGETMLWVYSKDRSKVDVQKLRRHASYMTPLLRHLVMSDIGHRVPT